MNSLRKLFITIVTVLLTLSDASHGQDLDVSPVARTSHVIQLLQDKSLEGWAADSKHWSVENGEIRGVFAEASIDQIKISTEQAYSEFRLIGQVAAPKGIEFLVDCDQFSITNKNAVEPQPPISITIPSSEEWTSFEVLVTATTIRAAANGRLIDISTTLMDRTKIERLQAASLKFRFEKTEATAVIEAPVRLRNLLLETFPDPELKTVKNDPATAPRIRELVRVCDESELADAAKRWTSRTEVIVPDELLSSTRNARLPLTSYGVRDSERDAYYALVQKARELPMNALKQAVGEWRDARIKQPEHRRYVKRPVHEFPMFPDLFRNPQLYHGKLVTLRGHIRKLAELPADENPYGIERLFEAWLFDEHAQSNPTVVICTSIDRRLSPEPDSVINHCVVTGYFFKNMAYDGQKDMRFAPLLIAQQLEYFPPEAATPSLIDRGLAAVTKRTGWSRQSIWLTLLVIVTMTSLFFARKWQRQSQPTRVSKTRMKTDSTQSATSKPVNFEQINDQGSRPSFSNVKDHHVSPVVPPERTDDQPSPPS